MQTRNTLGVGVGDGVSVGLGGGGVGNPEQQATQKIKTITIATGVLHLPLK
jgi:hypothetical protein